MNDQNQEEVKAEVIGVPEDKPSGLAITALVLGIVGVVCFLFPGLNFALGIAALIIGIIEFKKISAGTSSPKGRGMALAGIILGSVAIFAAIIDVIVISVLSVGFFSWLPSLTQMMQNISY